MEKSGLKKTSIGELGGNLPIGVNGSKAIEVRPWRMKEEKEIGEIRDKHRDMNMPQFVSVVLAHMLAKLGDHDFTTMPAVEKQLLIQQMYIPDVYYAWIYLRIQSLGAELELQVDCPRCRSNFGYQADLSSTEVWHCEDTTPPEIVYQVQRPFVIREQKVEQINFGPAIWDVLRSASGNDLNTGNVKSALLLGCIKSIPGIDNANILGPNELDEMAKLDLERALKTIDNKAPGVMMVLDTVCPKCQFQYEQNLDWGYDNFFGTSSPSLR